MPRGVQVRVLFWAQKNPAQVVKLVYTLLWGGSGRKIVWVRVSSCALRGGFFGNHLFFCVFLCVSQIFFVPLRRAYGIACSNGLLNGLIRFAQIPIVTIISCSITSSNMGLPTAESFIYFQATNAWLTKRPSVFKNSSKYTVAFQITNKSIILHTLSVCGSMKQ